MHPSSIIGLKRSTHLLAIVWWAWWRGSQRKRAWDRRYMWACGCRTWGGRRQSTIAVLRWGRPFLTPLYPPFCVTWLTSEAIPHECIRDVSFTEPEFNFFSIHLFLFTLFYVWREIIISLIWVYMISETNNCSRRFCCFTRPPGKNTPRGYSLT